LGQWDKALADFSKAIELDPKDALAWFDRGVTYWKQGQPEKAIPELQEAIRLKPGDPTWHTALGNLLLRQEHWAEAIAAFESATHLEPDSMDQHALLAQVLAVCPERKHRDPRRAVVEAKKAVELDRQSIVAWEVLGWAQ
jgi:tetratricopeptide (TPR) repeat protein